MLLGHTVYAVNFTMEGGRKQGVVSSTIHLALQFQVCPNNKQCKFMSVIIL
jgi:hypothetical protein